MTNDELRELAATLHAARAATLTGDSCPTELFASLYDELRAMARAKMRALPPGNTFQPTALVNEVWMRLEGGGEGTESKRHFFAAAARAMRDILVEQARAKSRLKRGGDRKRSEVEAEPLVEAESPVVDVLALHEALEKLEAKDTRKAQIVMLRYFSGLEHSEIAALLDVSERTVERDWKFAKAWLKDAMHG